MSELNSTAEDVTVNRPESIMTVTWSDRHQSSYSFALLRSICPCAYCDTGKHGGPARDEAAIRPADFKDIQVQRVEEVGHYALRFVWSDGHDSGIYSYEYLRTRCGCDQCKKRFL
ncbi:MAG: DUF971 domain-containing protein [Bacteroidetes bacterium]|nr:DUF971 domain-containing protein [Bacteroidota bacterium]